MTFISNDPSLWPQINLNIILSYFEVAACVIVVYDWVLTLRQEIELIWRQRWSLMTVLYLIIRFIGIPFSFIYLLEYVPSVSLTDTVSTIADYAVSGTIVIVTAMLGVIMISRLHAMYQGSRTILMFLVIIFLAVNIACGVITVIGLNDIRSSYFLAHMCAVMYYMKGTSSFCFQWFRFSTLFGRPSHCAFQSGLL
ncbi:uncharacterized protein HD556DRAFT_202617 [Suillus plorans]|uniref:DUF6533 domain-containing protein n=1 Tax=Suillus plorans TaxID=116603 RepID=A0A9P7D929_9AGAM|nr:uncharacterized protein HD556DRAFT_202617 [Suillus plorans]KAG1784725.1 hypothetical protein HD556DRAFT_202617 [Suillus plorans]